MGFAKYLEDNREIFVDNNWHKENYLKKQESERQCRVAVLSPDEKKEYKNEK